MSYCKFGPDSDIYLYSSTHYPDNAPCWMLIVDSAQEPETLFSHQTTLDRLLTLRNEGKRVPDAALERLQQEMKAKWHPAWSKVKRNWSDASIGFECPCGRDMVLDDESGAKTCECGRVYRYQTAFEVQGPQ